MKRYSHPGVRFRQSGTALVVGLILLMVLTLLAISGMNTATLELQMAGNFQYSQSAFQAAEVGIERAMQATGLSTSGTAVTTTRTQVPGASAEYYESVTRFTWPNGITPVPTGGYSMGSGGTGFSAYHFDVASTGTSARNARSVNTQSFYVVGPSGS